MSIESIKEDFHKEKNRLERIALNTKWSARTICIPFFSRDWQPICARYGYKEKKFLEISYVEEGGIKYVKIN